MLQCKQVAVYCQFLTFHRSRTNSPYPVALTYLNGSIIPVSRAWKCYSFFGLVDVDLFLSFFAFQWSKRMERHTDGGGEKEATDTRLQTSSTHKEETQNCGSKRSPRPPPRKVIISRHCATHANFHAFATLHTLHSASLTHRVMQSNKALPPLTRQPWNIYVISPRVHCPHACKPSTEAASAISSYLLLGTNAVVSPSGGLVSLFLKARKKTNATCQLRSRGVHHTQF